MNLKLGERAVRRVAFELLSVDSATSGHDLRRELRVRFGAAGNTARVFRLWQEARREFHERNVAQLIAAVPERAAFSALEARTAAAESVAAEQTARAERAEYRECEHQNHWAMQIDQLRGQLRTQPAEGSEAERLQTQVKALQNENLILRQQLNQARESLDDLRRQAGSELA